MAKQKTYADRAKQIMNKYKPRLGEKFDKGDTLALAAMNQELEALQQEQEQARIAKQETDAAFEQDAIDTFANGGKLNRKQQKTLSTILTNRKEETFAYGGGLPKFDGFSMSDLNKVGSTTTFIPNDGEGSWVSSPVTGDTGGGEGDLFEPFKSRVPWAGAVAQGLGSILENRQIDFGENEYKAQEVSPNLVDYSREREGFRRDRDNANAMIRQGAKGFGSKEALMGSTITGVTGTQRQTGKLTSQSLQGEENQNAQIKNQTAFFNAQQKNIADRLNTQQERENLLINEDRRANRIGGVTNAATGYGRDLMNADQYDQMLQMMAPENYMLSAGKDSGLRKFLQVSRPMQRSFLKGSQTLSG